MTTDEAPGSGVGGAGGPSRNEPGPRPCSWRLLLPRGRSVRVGPGPLVVGILNCTPDSFSDGGRYGTVEEAVAAAEAMLGQGADWIDVGGESTRPGAESVPADVQIDRVVPVIRSLRERTDVPLSVDTRSPAVGEAALEAGADIVNDVSACSDPAWIPVLAERTVPIVLVHMQGVPRSMQAEPRYPVGAAPEVLSFLTERIRALGEHGIAPDRIIVDPGIGFGKRFQDNAALIRNIDVLRSLGRPIMLGVSRKSFVRKILETAPEARVDTETLDLGTTLVNALALGKGIDLLRVHDVRQAAVLVRFAEALRLGDVSRGPGRRTGEGE